VATLLRPLGGWAHRHRIRDGRLRAANLAVIQVRDALCSSSDEGHDALMQMYHQRYTEQIEMADAATIIDRLEALC
jgi:hypothetical protein